MQTSLKYQYLDHKEDRPIRYVLSGSLQQKYNEFPHVEQTLKSTQICPYTSIRELIIAFKRNDYSSTDLHPCDILNEKYETNPKLLHTQRQMNSALKQIQESRIKFEKLKNCLEQYNNIYREMLQEIPDRIEPIRGSENEQQYNQRVSKMNEHFLEKQNKYFQYLTYSLEFERATTSATASQSHRFRPKQSLDRIDNFRFLSQKTDKIDQSLERLQRAYLDLIFDWKEFVKHGKSNISQSERNKTTAEWNKVNSDIDGIFTQMSDFSNWLDRDRREIREKYESNKNRYKRFYPEYIKIKQAYEISSKNSFYSSTIKEQKNRLQAHLKKNYGLIVPYAVSPLFAKAITPIQNPKNRELKKLIENQLTPLEDAILYINGQYQKLYKQACDTRDQAGTRKKIEENIKRFKRYAETSDDNKFADHLIESCQKLLRIVK